ncbi:MerR family transcriptional regulator [Frankia sp. QA3]|uniref:MerR family transcriptional regulator n=1 Tax=Frankia sp. QA3 TaxID=710111 RepID=UPI001E5D3ACD|nr:MerR family transcriptional regulator [Frankia sp. QA3]
MAAATGVTVRALHHFDGIGLLRASERTHAGHRMYSGEDLRRLYRILALRQLGMPLADVSTALDGEPDSLEQAVRGQLDQVTEDIHLRLELRRRLRALLDAFAGTRQPSIDELISVMEAMMQASYFTPAQLDRLRERHREAGDAGFDRWKERLGELVEEVDAHRARGTDPADEAAQLTARHWRVLMDHMTGGDPGILSAMYAKIDDQGPEAATTGMVTTAVWEYLRRAFAVGFSPGN